jgi:protein-S-isoprenylcysteine O-methyltransferase Ste14
MKSRPYAPLAFLAGSIIFIGLPLLGWGIRQVPHFFDNPARTAYVVVMLLLQLVSVVFFPQAGREQGTRKNGLPQRKSDVSLTQFFTLAIVLLAPFSDQRAMGVLDVGDVFRFSGLMLAVPGFLLMLIAEKHLGKQFSVEVTIQEDHELIRSGPYKIIRHPRYLGIVMLFLGISLTFRSYLAILVVIALLFVLIWRVSAEESLMRQEFGAEWDEYCAHSWRIIPFVF